MPENKFNLINEPWIPMIGEGRVSLKQIFTNARYRALGGNPVQKIALTKLLLAIAQAAYTPSDDEDWKNLGAVGIAQKCLSYLEKWYDRFYLYGENPFLQMSVIEDLIAKRDLQQEKTKKAKGKKQEADDDDEALKGIGTGMYPDLPAPNNTILTQDQFKRVLSDAEKAVFVVTLMNFAFGGKRVEKKLGTLTSGYAGKTDSARAAPSIGNYVGYLHSHVLGPSLHDTLWLNLLTEENINDHAFWEFKLGRPPWENMPQGEDCAGARQLKNSYMGCLVAMSRFVLLKGEGIYYVEGIQYPSHKEGWREPSMAINSQSKNPKLLWVNPNKRPWRELTSLLSFISGEMKDFDCMQLRYLLTRFRMGNECSACTIWSGGIRVSSNSGDQSIKSDDDFVESQVVLPRAFLNDDDGFGNLKAEMGALDTLSTAVYKGVVNYFAQQCADPKYRKKQAESASNLFWQLCERRFQNLVDVCHDIDAVKQLRKVFAGFVNKSYDTLCPKDTARQLDAWAKCKPKLYDYLDLKKREEKDE